MVNINDLPIERRQTDYGYAVLRTSLRVHSEVRVSDLYADNTAFLAEYERAVREQLYRHVYGEVQQAVYDAFRKFNEHPLRACYLPAYEAIADLQDACFKAVNLPIEGRMEK